MFTMVKRILTVGIELASSAVEEREFTSKASLLDWDIFVLRPRIGRFVGSRTYQNKPWLDESESFKLKEACEHWRREVKQAVENGKTVICFLSPLVEVYIDTGRREYSGTGRNQKTTRLLDLYSNYGILPTSLSLTQA